MKIVCQDHYDKVVEYAKSIGDTTLQECLERVRKYEIHMKAEARLMRDRSKHSLYFELYDKADNLVMNGGIVYHGDPDESYSYTTDPTKGWQVHT